jgi:alpha-amylase
VDTENANYDYLMGADIDHRFVDPLLKLARSLTLSSHPDVEKDVLDWGEWVLKEVRSLGRAGEP